jgi:hypothetical protein
MKREILIVLLQRIFKHSFYRNSETSSKLIFILYLESKPEIDINYPSEAYGDLMALVMKHKFNNATGNAIKYNICMIFMILIEQFIFF